MSVLIATKDLTIRYGKEAILENVSLTIRKGEIVTLVGPNGSGKSTLLKALIGAVAPAAGTVLRDPTVSIGYVPQRLHLDSGMPLTVERFMALPKRRSVKAVQAALTRVGVQDTAKRQMVDLSGGQMQRVLLARALITEPDLLLLDEPTQGLDQPAEADFYELLENVRTELGCAVVMVSHDLHVVMSASDRVICINGHICCEGTPTVVSSAPEYRALFGQGTRGALALYQHQHDHRHDQDQGSCDHDHSAHTGSEHTHGG